MKSEKNSELQHANKLAIVVNNDKINLSQAQQDKLTALFQAEVTTSASIVELAKLVQKAKKEIADDAKTKRYKELRKQLKAVASQHKEILENKNGALALALADFEPGKTLIEKLQLIFPTSEK